MSIKFWGGWFGGSAKPSLPAKKIDVERVSITVVDENGTSYGPQLLLGYAWVLDGVYGDVHYERASKQAEKWREEIGESGLVPIGNGSFMPVGRVLRIEFKVSEYLIDEPR